MTTLKNKIILLLADNPEREFYGQEIARRIRCSKASVSGILKKLYFQGLVSKDTKGHMVFYRIRAGNSEVKRLKIDSVLKKIGTFLPLLKKNSKKIILFGSSSRGEQTRDSDIDLIIISDDKNRVRTDIKKLKKPKLKVIIKTPGEWSEMEVREKELRSEIENGIILYEYVPRI